jgi:hypothetical protein
MIVTPDGIQMDVSDSHSEKADDPRDESFDPASKVTLDMPVHLRKQ